MKTLPATDDRSRVRQNRWELALLAALAIAAPAVVCAKVSISVEDGVRTVTSDGMPDHEIGQFPNDHNPNTASSKKYDFKMPADPKFAEMTTALGMWPFGVAVDGVPFDPFAAEWWKHDPRSGWQYEPMAGFINLGMDKSNAHVQPDGAYHYHGVPNILVKGTTEPVLLGYAADGFPIYGPYGYKDAKDKSSAVVKLKSGYKVKSGKRPENGPGGEYDGKFVQDYEWAAGVGDLDESNGRTGVTPEYPNGTYYYVLTETFPYVPRIFKGKPDSSFLRKPPPFGFRGGPGGRRAGMPPPGMRGMGQMADNSQPMPGMHGGPGTGARREPRTSQPTGEDRDFMGPPPMGQDGQPRGPRPGTGGQDDESVGPRPGMNGKTNGSSKRGQMPGGRRPAMGDSESDMGGGPEGMRPGAPPPMDGEDEGDSKMSGRMHRMPPPARESEEDGNEGGRPPRPEDGDGHRPPPPPPDDAILEALFGSDTDAPPPPPTPTSSRKKGSSKSGKTQY